MRVLLPFLLTTVASLLAGCNEASLANAPDASPGCQKPEAIAPCVALDAGVTGCTGNLGSEPALGVAAYVDASYPVGCQLIVNDPTPDQDNQCSQLGTCMCMNDAGPYTWFCQP